MSSPLIRTSLVLGLATASLAAQTAQERLAAPLALSVSEAFRMGFSVSGAGARAMGMGGAFVGVADDGTAASFNPAGLAQLRTFEASLVMRQSSFGLDLDRTTLPVGDKVAPYALAYDHSHGETPKEPQFVSLAVPFTVGGRNMVVQASRQRMFAMDLDYNRAWREDQTDSSGAYRNLAESTSQRGDLTRWNLAAGMELNPRILFGAAWNHWGGAWSFDASAHGRTDSGGRFSLRKDAWAHLNQDSKLSGQNWTLGLLWRSDQVRVGVAYQTAFTAKFRYAGDYRFLSENGLDVYQLEGPIEVGSRAYEVHWPEVFSAGVSYRPHPQWLVALDWSRTPWDKMRIHAPGTLFDGNHFLDPAPMDQVHVIDPENPPSKPFPGAGSPVNATTLRLGAEHLLFVKRWIVPVRIGGFIEPQPLRDPITHENRVLRGFTFGTGVKAGNLTFDMAWKFARSKRMTGQLVTPLSIGNPDSDGYAVMDAPERESIQTREFVASLIYQFKGEAVRRAFRWLLVTGE